MRHSVETPRCIFYLFNATLQLTRATGITGSTQSTLCLHIIPAALARSDATQQGSSTPIHLPLSVLAQSTMLRVARNTRFSDNRLLTEGLRALAPRLPPGWMFGAPKLHSSDDIDATVEARAQTRAAAARRYGRSA